MEEVANEEKKESLWETFLSDAAKSTNKHSAATVIVCGEKGNPFADIIHSMKSSSSKMGRPEEQLPYFLNYRYVDADSAVDEALHLHTWTVQVFFLCFFWFDIVINGWALKQYKLLIANGNYLKQDPTHFEQIPTILPDKHIAEGKLGYIMCIDTSKPSTIKTQFQKWTAFISKAQELVFKKVGDQRMQAMKDDLSRRLQFYEVAGTETLLDEEEKEAIRLNREKPHMNFGVHITVVVCNTELFAKNYPQSQAAASKMFERALLFLREMSLEIGAALFTFASRRQGTTIKQYIDSVLLGQKLTQEPQIANIILQELKEEQVFVPAGFDSEGLLAGSALGKQKKKFDDVFPKKLKRKKERAEFKKQSETDDQHFLALLRFELNKVREQMEKLDKRGPMAQMKLAPKVKKFMNDQLQIEKGGYRMPDLRRRSSMTHKKSRRTGRRHKDHSHATDRAYKALGLIKPG